MPAASTDDEPAAPTRRQWWEQRKHLLDEAIPNYRVRMVVIRRYGLDGKKPMYRVDIGREFGDIGESRVSQFLAEGKRQVEQYEKEHPSEDVSG
jgi:hypothetical protein